MSLDRIYASKMYLTSTRKDRIHAAIQDPLNIELVRQVSDYLDSDSKAKLRQAVVEEEAAKDAASQESASAENEANVFDDGGSGFSGGSSGGSYHGGSGSSGDVFDAFDSSEGGSDDLGTDMSDGDFDAPDSGDDDAPAPETDVDIAESTEVIADAGIEVTSSEDAAPAIQSGIIKKLLNDQDDTRGVVRVDPTDDEVWIYYEDKINLNDVMDNVISIIKSNGYDMLKFSRLARTDNAIVFDIKE